LFAEHYLDTATILLLHGADMSQRNAQWRTPLAQSMLHHSWRMTGLLLDLGPM
jgi:hypothetical protein